MTTFTDKWRARNAAGKHICIGLDPKLSELPSTVPGETDAERVYNFLVGIIDNTHEYAAAYKPQIAFFEALGDDGHRTLRRVIQHIRHMDNGIPVILDYKRGDIGSTNEGYISLAVDYFDVDAITINPYLGMEANRPFLSKSDLTVIVLCRTSNPGAGEFQDLRVRPVRSKLTGKIYSTKKEARREGDKGPFKKHHRMPLYQFVAHRVAQSWNELDNCAVVVGATFPKELGLVRRIVDSMLILVPGLGTQGGDMVETFSQGIRNPEDLLSANNASAINFAYKKLRGDDTELKYTSQQYGEAAAEAANDMNDAVRTLLPV